MADSTERLELERLAADVVVPLPELTALSAFTRLLFAVGLARVGASAAAKEAVERVEAEIPVHEPVNQVLFRLLIARIAFETTDSDEDVWRTDVERMLSEAPADVRKHAEWLAKRSRWLGLRVEESPRSLSPRVVRTVREVTKRGYRNTLFDLWRRGSKRDEPPQEWEAVGATEHIVVAVAQTGSAKVMHEVLDGIERVLPDVKVPAHRVRLICATLRGAAAVDDEDRVEGALNDIARLAKNGDLPWIREVKAALRPALSALRRLGMPERAVALLDALIAMPTRTKSERVMLRATLADGFLAAAAGE